MGIFSGIRQTLADEEAANGGNNTTNDTGGSISTGANAALQGLGAVGTGVGSIVGAFGFKAPTNQPLAASLQANKSDFITNAVLISLVSFLFIGGIIFLLYKAKK